MMCLTISGCGGLTLGPTVKTEYVIVKPGLPCQVLENQKLRVKPLNGSADSVEQDIGGWVCMPPSHWEVIKPILEESRKE
jgi:hypothetical protein